MADLKLRSSPRDWQDWLGIVLGIVIALAPWIAEETSNEPAIVNAALAGFAAMLLAELDLVALRRWAEAGQIVCGVWVAVSPIVFGYSDVGALRFWHLLTGFAVAALGFLELGLFRRHAPGK